jgi:DNA-binding IclR family transcriptional regulator
MSDTIKVIDKALDVLELLAAAQDFMSAQQISKEIGQPKSTIHRILNTLAARGYIRKDEKAHTYGIGLKLLQIKESAKNDLDLTKIGHPILQSLAKETGATAHLSRLSYDSINYIDYWVPPTGTAIRFRLGEHVPLYCTSLGKALIAWLPEDELDEIINSMEFEAYSPYTITDPEEFREELRTVRIQGYAEDREESAIGIRCVGAPIWDDSGNVVAAISVTTLAAQIDESTLTANIQTVQEHANRLSIQLGYDETLIGKV